MKISLKNIKKYPKDLIVHQYDLSLDNVVNRIEREQSKYGLNIMPDFQRSNHIWNRSQQKKYIEHLLMGGITGKEIYFNVSKWPKSDFPKEGTYYLVDGLQRITAITDFYAKKFPIFGGAYVDEITDLDIYASETYLHIKYLGYQSIDDIIMWYIGHNSGGTPHTKQEIERVKAMLPK